MLHTSAMFIQYLLFVFLFISIHAIFILYHLYHIPVLSYLYLSISVHTSLALAEFDGEFQYRAGNLNIAADALSHPGPAASTG